MSEAIDKKHPAVYEKQIGNVIDGTVTCAVTTLSMLVQSKDMKPGEAREAKHIEDAILLDLKFRYPDSHKTLREDFNFLAKYAKEKYGVALKYAAYNKNDWIAKITNGTAPFMTSTSNALTKFGHVVLSRGIKAEQGKEVLLYFNDPYGCYPYNGKSGEDVAYPASLFPFDDGKGEQKTYHTLSYL